MQVASYEMTASTTDSSDNSSRQEAPEDLKEIIAKVQSIYNRLCREYELMASEWRTYRDYIESQPKPLENRMCDAKFIAFSRRVILGTTRQGKLIKEFMQFKENFIIFPLAEDNPESPRLEMLMKNFSEKSMAFSVLMTHCSLLLDEYSTNQLDASSGSSIEAIPPVVSEKEPEKSRFGNPECIIL